MGNTKFQPCRRFVWNDLVERKIKSCRKASEKFLKFKEKLGLDPYKITCDEQDIISALQVAFENEIIHTQYCIFIDWANTTKESGIYSVQLICLVNMHGLFL